MRRIDEEYIQKRGPYGLILTPVEKSNGQKRLGFTWNAWSDVSFISHDLKYGGEQGAFCGSFIVHWDNDKSLMMRKDCKTGKFSEKTIPTPDYVKKLKYEEF